MHAAFDFLHTRDAASLMFRIALAATVVVALTAALVWLCSSWSAARRHALWLACIGALLALPIAATILPTWRIPIAIAESAAPTIPIVASPMVYERHGETPAAAKARAPIQTETVDREQSAAAPQSEARDAIAKPEPRPAEETPHEHRQPEPLVRTASWETWLIGAWLTGFIACLLYFALCQVLATIVIRSSSAKADGPINELAESLPQSLGIDPRSIAIRFADRAFSPMTFGWRRPVIILPRGAESWSDTQLRHVLIHELAHIKRRDWATQVCSQLACAMYWCHPLVWLAAARMRRAADCSADDVVLANGEPAPAYAESLVTIAKSLRRRFALAHAAVPMARAGSFESRVGAILSAARDRRPASRRSMFLLFVAFCLFVTPLTAIRLSAQSDNGDKKPEDGVGGANSIRLDRLPKGIVTALGSDRFRSAGHQKSICYSSDGRIIATGNDDSIDLFDAETGERLKQFTTEGDQYTYETFHHVQFIDGDKRLVCSAYPDARLLIWNIETGKLEVNVHTHERHIFDLDVSPDERLVATAGDDAKIRLWEVATGNKRVEINLKREARDLEFSSDGRELYAWFFNEHQLRRFDVESGKLLESIETKYYHATLLPNADRIVAGDNRQRIVHGLALPYEKLELPKSDDHPTVIGYSTDGRQVLTLEGTSHDYVRQFGPGPPRVELWDLEERRLVQSASLAQVRRPDGGGGASQFAISPDGKTLAHTRGLQVDRWNLETGEAYPPPEGHVGSVRVSFSKGGSVLATLGTEDGSIRLWDVPTGKPIKVLQGTPDEYWPEYGRKWEAHSVGWINDDLVAAAPINRGIRVWNIDKSANFSHLPLEFDSAGDGYWSSFTAVGELFGIAKGDQVLLFDRNSSKSVGTLTEHWGAVSILKATPDGRYLASGSLDRSVVLWDVKARSLLHVLEGARGTIRSLSVSSDGRIVAATSDEGDWIIWNGQSGKVLHHFPKPTEHGVGTVTVSAKGDLIAAGGKDLRIYDPITAEEKARVTEIDGWIGAIEFSPDGKVLATGSWRSRPRLWNVDALLRASENAGN